MMTIALADGEAEAFFAVGQGFTIWADGEPLAQPRTPPDGGG